MTETVVRRTWQDLLNLDPSLVVIDRVLANYRQRIRAGNQWRLYEDAKYLVSERVGWFAYEARSELRTSEAYDIGINHVLEVLEI